MASSTRGRLVSNNQVVLDQADFFQSDGYTRVTGLTIVSVQATLFYNNMLQPWILTDGTGLTDGQITSGKVFWNEIPGSPGYYSVRFTPNAVGYWRLLINYPVGTQIAAQDYDVADLAFLGSPGAGLSSSFNRPGCG